MSVAEVSNRKIAVADGDKLRKKSVAIANAMALEMANYGYAVDEEIVRRISRHKRRAAAQLSGDILKTYTLGELNRPLFDDWEFRQEFTFPERVLQIFGYMLQLSGNDLYDPQFMQRLRSQVGYKKLKALELADQDAAVARFQSLIASRVALDKSTFRDLVVLAAKYHDKVDQRIRSNEARIAVLVGMVDADANLLTSLLALKCTATDVLRYAAARHSFEGVKLAADVKYASLPWRDRINLLRYLNSFTLSELCEEMGVNRQAWLRFFRHINLFAENQRFFNRTPVAVTAGLISVGTRLDTIPPGKQRRYLDAHRKLYDVTESGNIAYRTFASRVQSAVDNQDFDAFESEIQNQATYLFRNLAALSNVCTKKTESRFVELVRSMIGQTSVSVLFSLIQINVDSEYRIIDSKGNTTVTAADYAPVIAEIQGLAEREIHRRFGRDGQVVASSKVRDRVVPFLATNAELERGTRVPFGRSRYLYTIMHWVQTDRIRTDLDLGFIAYDSDWKPAIVNWQQQANQYITHSGDITNAPAPHGGTEYGRIDLAAVPENVCYIVPNMMVYCGDDFATLPVAYAGFLFSDSAEFSINRKHTRYDLTQPARSNVPYVIDVKARELIIVDFNNRQPGGITASSIDNEVRMIISALKSKRFMTIGRLAAMLSGDDPKVELTIKPSAKSDSEIEPKKLHSLFE